MFRSFLTILLLALTGRAAIPQQAAHKEESPKCSFSEAYRKDGWTIPGLQQATVKSRAAFKNIPGVFAITLSPVEPETTIMQISCSRDHSGQIEIEDLPIRILDLTAYEYNGRVFAYGISYEKQAVENNVRVPLGAASGVLFYDRDRSGRFTVRKFARWPFNPDPPTESVSQP